METCGARIPVKVGEPSTASCPVTWRPFKSPGDACVLGLLASSVVFPVPLHLRVHLIRYGRKTDASAAPSTLSPALMPPLHYSALLLTFILLGAYINTAKSKGCTCVILYLACREERGMAVMCLPGMWMPGNSLWKTGPLHFKHTRLGCLETAFLV